MSDQTERVAEHFPPCVDGSWCGGPHCPPRRSDQTEREAELLRQVELWRRAENAQTALLREVFDALGGDPVRDKVNDLARQVAARVRELEGALARVDDEIQPHIDRALAAEARVRELEAALTELRDIAVSETFRANKAEARVRELEGAAQQLRDAHQGAVEKVARVEALARWLVDEGHLTPMGKRQLDRVLRGES